jgi:lysyl-tRNA synthetase class 2
MQTGLPDCTGVALGFDRFVMAATGAKSIDNVQTFGIDRA